MTVDDVFFAKWRALIKTAPPIIRELLEQNGDLRERPDFHPELSTLEHIRIVTFRVMAITRTTDPVVEVDVVGAPPAKGLIDFTSLLFTAILHDIGKKATAAINPKTGWPTCPGHDKWAAALIRENLAIQEWIADWGGDWNAVAWLCEQHMRVKQFDQMKESKRLELQQHPLWCSLSVFTLLDIITVDFNGIV